MIEIDVSHPDGKTGRVAVPDDCIVGKHEDCDLRLSGWSIAQRHARIFRTPAGIFVDSLGSLGGILVGGERVSERHGPLSGPSVIEIGRFQIRIVTSVHEMESQNRSSSFFLDEKPPLQRLLPVSPSSSTSEAKVNWERSGAGLTESDLLHATDHANVAGSAVNVAFRKTELSWRQKIHTQLLQEMDLRRRDVSAMDDDELRTEVSGQISRILAEVGKQIPPEIDRTSLAQLVLDEAVGLGPLEPLLSDDAVSEIMVNRHDEIFVERAGRLEMHTATFSSERAVVGVIERIVTPLGRRIDESSPMVDARLKDGSRVNAVIAPLALRGASVTIRKFAKHRMTVDEIVKRGSLSAEMAEFLRMCVVNRKNIVVSGGTGSGKTTLLNILSNFIPPGERIVTVEDAAELQLTPVHLVSLEARPPNAEGKGLVSIRDLVRNTLRMRPDRIVIGECRGAEALDMLQAMNTGHEGSLTTLHANTPRDALARLETMVLMAGMDLPLVAIREQIASAVDIIVQPIRYPCGTRLIASISEVTGMESGRFQVQELFRFANLGHEASTNGRVGKVKGHFMACGMVPQFYEELASAGVNIDLTIFDGKGQE